MSPTNQDPKRPNATPWNWPGLFYAFCIALVAGAIILAFHYWPLKDAGSALSVAFLVACGIFLVGALLAAANRSPKSPLTASDRAKALEETPYWLDRLYAVLIVGVVAIFFYAAHFGSFADFVSAFSVGFLGACGAFLAGALLGVLYGMPVDKANGGSPKPSDSDKIAGAKDNAQDTNKNTKNDDKTPAYEDAPSPRSPFRPSTRLQEIADWLTKIIIGLGLAQIGKIPGKLWQLAHFLGHALGDSPTADAVALTILIAYVTGGFLIGFIWADAYLPNILAQTYYNLRGRVEKLEKYIAKFDLDALRLTEQWLSRSPGDEWGAEKLKQEINKAVYSASPPARYQTFYQAYELDRPDWTRGQRMDRRVAIYEALVDQDKDGVFHRNRGQLGIALATRTDLPKVPPPADLETAITTLTDAIHIRDNGGDSGWKNYEFYLAYAMINHPQKREEFDNILLNLQVAHQRDELLVRRLKEAQEKPDEVGRIEYLLGQRAKGEAAAPGHEAPAKEDHDEYTTEDFVVISCWFDEKKTRASDEEFARWHLKNRQDTPPTHG